jgi:hypothetical protein
VAPTGLSAKGPVSDQSSDQIAEAIDEPLETDFLVRMQAAFFDHVRLAPEVHIHDCDDRGWLRKKLSSMSKP